MNLLKLLIALIVLGGIGYLVFVPGASLSDFQKFIPGSDATTDPSAPAPGLTKVQPPTPKLAPPKPPETIQLKNGKSIVGNIVIRDTETSIIRTPDGKTTEVKTRDIVVTP